jgi:ABC-type branched-subunit amino acid transport system substrate-binding protein
MKIFANRSAISSAVAAVMLIVGLAVGAGAVYAIAPGTTHTVTTTVAGSGTTQTVTGAQGPVTYTLGTVLPLSGQYGSYGLSFQNSVDLAVSQMNANLTAAGSNIQFKVVHADDGGSPQTANTALQSEFQSAGIQVEIGPLTSAEVLGLVQTAAQNHIVILPGASTGTALEGISPYVFRPGQPGDQFEGQTIAQSVIQTGGKNVVYLYRDDTSEYGTFNISSAVMEAAGLNVMGIALPPAQNDYSAQVQTAQSDVGTFLSGGGTTKNTVVVIGDGGTEAQNIFTNAATTANLGQVRWYGIESLADPTLLGSSVGSFMAQTNLTIAVPQVLNSPQFEYFNSTYTAMYGSAPLPYSNYFYDNTWIGMLSVLAAGSYNGANIIKVVSIVADHFYGSSSTGIWLVHHDQSIAYYDVLKCTTVGGKPTFVKIGTYNGGTNQLTLS